MLAQPSSGFEEFLLEEALVEADLLEYLFAELHHLSSLFHHHGSAFARLKIPQQTGVGQFVMEGFPPPDQPVNKTNDRPEGSFPKRC